MSIESQRLGRATGKPWNWPTPEECLTRSPLTDAQAVQFARAIEWHLRETLALVCHELESQLVRQPVHVPVLRALKLLDDAAAWSPPTQHTAAPAAATSAEGPFEAVDGSMEGF